MYCTQCGEKLSENAMFCGNCGASLPAPAGVATATAETWAQESANAPCAKPSTSAAPTLQAAQSVTQTAPGSHPYHSLGGFLLAIVVCSYIGAAICFLYAILAVVGLAEFFIWASDWSSYSNYSSWGSSGAVASSLFSWVYSIVLLIIAGCLTIVYANKIRRKDTNFLRFIQSASIVVLGLVVVGNLIQMISLNLYYDVSGIGVSIGQLIGIIIGGIVSIALHSAYFASSVRVRTYMGTDAYLRQSIFNRKTVSPIPADGSDSH